MKQKYLWLLLMWGFAFAMPNINAQQIVANYDFNGNAKDVSGNNNNATIYGALLTQDRFGNANQAFQFDGEQSHLLAGNSANLNSANATVSFWIRADEIPAQGEVYILSFGGWQERWKISLPAHGKMIWTTHATTCCVDLDAGDGNELVPGTWTHLVMSHDAGMEKIYVNGVLTNQKASNGDLSSTTYPFGMGYDPIDNDYHFKGALDEVTIFDDALSDMEVMDLYTAQSTPPVVGDEMVANYSFSGHFNDASAYANNASGKNVVFGTDRFGFGKDAVVFNGVDAGVTASNTAQLNSASTTVSFWINAASLPAQGEGYIASFGGWQERWKISLPSHGKMVWTTHATSCCSDLDAGDGNELVPGNWTHAVFVHDGTMDRIFINGVLAAEKASAGDLNNTTHPLGIGYDPIDVANYFDGSIDDFQIYSYALSDTEISDLYAAQNSAVIDPDPLVLNLPFAGDYNDVSQFKNNGEATNVSMTNDRFGYANNAIAISSVDPAYVNVDNSVQYNSDFQTVSFWVKMNELPASGEVYLMSFGGWQERWKISLPSHGKVVWTTYATSCCSDMDAGDGNELVVGEWMHVVASHGTAQDRIYINGALAASKDNGGALNPTTYPLGIGWNPIDGSNYMNGDMDEVQIYNTELTEQEVADLYAAQSVAPVFPGDIVADYPLDASAKDVSPYRNNGNASGAVAAKDRFGRANHSMNFTGNGGVTADNSPQLNSPLASVSFWVNPNSLPASGEAYLFSFGGWQERCKISLPSHGKPVWTTHATSCCSDLDSGDGNELVPGTWTHLVMVHDGTKDYIYVDGVLANEKDSPGDLNSTSYPLGLGYDPIDMANYFDGSMDDVLLFQTALTAQEVADLYAAQSADPGDPDVTAPDAPIDLQGSVVFTTISLTWQPSVDGESGIAGYNVFQDGELIMTRTEPNATIAGLTPLTSYEFGVSAIDVAGNESTRSYITIMTDVDEMPDVTPPTIPTNLAVSPGANSVVFSWDASTDDTAIKGYVTFVDGNYVDSLTAAQLSVFIGGLDPSTLYTFEVYAYDLAGNDSEVAFITESTTDPIVTAEPGLVAHYKFEGNADDSTPYNNHGAIGGNPTFQPVTNRPNAEGMSIVFDGDGDSILAPNGVQLISDYTTVSFWIRVDGINLDDAESYVLDFGHWNERWKISLPQHLKPVWTTNGNNAMFPNFISDMDSGDGNELVISFWWHVTMVHDGTHDIIYLDGVEVNRKPVATKLNSTANPFGMGNNPIEGGQYFWGSLDEVKVYNKALTDDEIFQNYSTGATSIKDLQNEVSKYVEILYPNPTDDILTVKHRFGVTQDLLVRLFDQNGRQVGSKRIPAQDMDNGLFNIDVDALSTGIYSVNFVLGGKALGSLPFIKQ